MVMLPVVLLAFAQAGDPGEVLRHTAAVYENLRSFVITASLSFKVPGQDAIVTTGETASYATSAMLPADAPIPVLGMQSVGGGTVIRNSAGEKVDVNLSGFPIGAFPFQSLDMADKRLVSARALPDETLTTGGEPIPCAVIEAAYEKRSELGRGNAIRFWIDKKTYFVRQARYQAPGRSDEVVEWTARVEKMIINEPVPQYALDHMGFLKGREQTKWVGAAAPDFTMKALDGRAVTRASLRSKVVVLDFWATWCGPCREEMPLLEKLRDELKSQGVEIWGVTDEKPEDARRWLAERKRTLPTLIDADRTLFRHYGIESIPALMVLRRDGTVSSFVVGLRNEVDVRADVAKAM